MKLLLDESIDVRLRVQIVGHDVYTVDYMRWKGTKNGVFSVAPGLITPDQNIETQQNPATLPVALIVLIAPSNDLDDLTPLVPDLLKALGNLTPRSVVHVGPIRP